MIKFSPKFIDIGNGEEIVILTRAEYDALLSLAAGSASDVAPAPIDDARMADPTPATDAAFPDEVNAYLMAGDPLLMALRRWRNFTHGELAKRAGLAQSYVSDVESGRREGTGETLASLARALEVSENWLIPAPIAKAPK